MLPIEGWHKSTRSTDTNRACVEVARRGPGVGVRDSKDVARRPLSFGGAAWAAFLGAGRPAGR